MEIKLLNDMSEAYKHWCRDEAIILANGKFYNDINHQYAIMNFMDVNWDMEDDFEIEEAISYTDKLFRDGNMIGLDLFFDGKGNKYLFSHYPNAFNSKRNAKLICDYASKHGYILGTFTNENKLGDICFTIEVI